jgi:photosystem II stability/assembly factor-like uncharacterized protein
MRSLLPLLAVASLATPLAAQAPTRAASLDSATLAGMRWRQVGPANMSGRITDVEGIPGSKTIYAAAAAGGIWKTTNNGTTWRPVWRGNGRVISMGDLAVAPSDTNVIYAGTGEPNSRNSISPGGGVFKSTDGGKTWQAIGLERTQTVGRIVVHPTDPNTAYVAALGAIWNANPERGLYKTTDGGKTWTLSKFVSDKAGFVDVAMDPRDPNVLYAASWERVRGPHFLKSGGPGSALWKTTDAGATWTKIEGSGWPTTTLGRIGLGMSPSDPSTIYAMVEADSLPGQGRLNNGLYKTTDAGRSWTKVHDSNTRPFYYSQVRVHPTDPNTFWFSSTPVLYSRDGGKTVGNATVGIHVDHHAMWIDPTDPQRMIVGNDGGVALSWDGGGTWDFQNHMALGQFYEVSYDMAVPYRVCGGLQDNGSWCGPSRRRGETTNAFWFTVNGGDGFYTQQDPTDPNVIYAESQGGRMSRIDYATGERSGIGTPNWRSLHTQWEDSILIARGDTTRPAPAAAQRRIAELRRRQAADSAAFDLRFNWNTPFLLSPHNPRVFYAAANRVLKSTDRGANLTPISPDLSKQDWEKIKLSVTTTGGITNDATGAETYGTVTALAESYVRPGLLFAGTDDGNVWMTRNDGAEWENLTARFPGLPANGYVARIEPSHADTNVFYVAVDHHRTGDFKPYLYMTADGGKSFRSIASNLPTDGVDFMHVVREDPYNPNLLYAGTDVGVYVSLDRGASWQRFMTDLPTVPVHDLKIHPRDRELIAATHGRSIWIADVLPLQQMADSVMNAAAWLYAPKIAYQWGQSPALGESAGHKLYTVSGPPFGAELTYRIGGRAAAAASASGNGNGDGGAARQPARAQARVIVQDVAGDTLATLTGPATPGVHRVYWNFTGKRAPAPALSPSQLRDSVVNARKVQAVVDSMVAAGHDRATLDRVQAQMAGGGFGGFGGGGGGGADYGELAWNERPGESPARPVTLAGARPAAGAAPRAAAGMSEADVRSELLSAMRAAGLGGRGGFGGGRGFGGAGPVSAGDYLVTLVANGVTQKRVLRVERVAGATDEAIMTMVLEELGLLDVEEEPEDR